MHILISSKMEDFFSLFSILLRSKSKVIMEFKKKENKLKITGRAAAVEETKSSAEVLRQTLVTADYEVHRPGKCFRLFKYLVLSTFRLYCCAPCVCLAADFFLQHQICKQSVDAIESALFFKFRRQSGGWKYQSVYSGKDL